REVRVAERDALDAAETLGRRKRLTVCGDPTIDVPSHRLGPAEDPEGEGLFRCRVDRPGDLDRVTGKAACCDRVTTEEPKAGSLPDRARPRRRGRRRRDQAQGLLDGGLGSGPVARLPEEPPQSIVKCPKADRIGASIFIDLRLRRGYGLPTEFHGTSV